MLFIRLIKADRIKLFKTSFFLLHVLIPTIAAGSLYIYSNTTSYDKVFLSTGYLELVSVFYPIIIALLSSIVAELEAEAGNCYFMLRDSRIRYLPIISKITILLVCGLAACFIISIGLIAAGGDVFTKTHPVTMSLSIVFVLWFSNIALYLFHFIIAFSFGRTINLSLGAIELLTAALLTTSLGDRLWYYIPCCYGVRLSSMWLLRYTVKDGLLLSYFNKQISYGLASAVFMIILSAVILLIWGSKWESRKFE